MSSSQLQCNFTPQEKEEVQRIIELEESGQLGGVEGVKIRSLLQKALLLDSANTDLLVSNKKCMRELRALGGGSLHSSGGGSGSSSSRRPATDSKPEGVHKAVQTDPDTAVAGLGGEAGTPADGTRLTRSQSWKAATSRDNTPRTPRIEFRVSRGEADSTAGGSGSTGNLQDPIVLTGNLNRTGTPRGGRNDAQGSRTIPNQGKASGKGKEGKAPPAGKGTSSWDRTLQTILADERCLYCGVALTTAVVMTYLFTKR
jgi:hypothetical protein